ncbi:hypothetical protein L289_0617 [Acinetobacter gerneri DSM 14967 = CIP 107464 = MTCC 9824]|nr:hypothetical protein L289_0617 [Acinetobacter gerneri DSM 14967 = CIP 107464 = MTCC 9824]
MSHMFIAPEHTHKIIRLILKPSTKPNSTHMKYPIQNNS